MKKITRTALSIAAALIALASARSTHADWQAEDTGVPVWVDAEPPFCKTDADCVVLGLQCNTSTGVCYAPSSATSCACAPDGDPCTDDAGIVTGSGMCFCPHTPLTTPECTMVKRRSPLFPMNPIEIIKKPSDPGTSDPTPDPVSPTPPLPPAVKIPDVCADPSLSADQRLCCVSVGGNPLLMMEKCVSDEKRSSDCDIVVNVMGDVGDKAQMNVCCNLLNNDGTIADSTIDQECENTFGDKASASAPGATSPSGEESSTTFSSDTKAASSDTGAPTGGCSLIRD